MGILYLQIQYQMSLIAQNRHTFPYYNHLWLGFQENCVLNCIWNAFSWTREINLVEQPVYGSVFKADQIAEIVFPFKELRASGRYIFIKAAPFRSHFTGYESFSWLQAGRFLRQMLLLWDFRILVHSRILYNVQNLCSLYFILMSVFL